MAEAPWPALPLEPWADTYATLHMWTQVVGKVALALAPPLNHSWGVALQLTPRGLTTRSLPYGRLTFTIAFDFIDHRLVVQTSDGAVRTLDLRTQSVAEFYAAVMRLLDEMSLHVKIWAMPVEIPSPIRFDQDTVHRAYDRDAVGRFWQVIVAIAPVFSAASCRFVGKCSPLHFFWGAFDIALTRFSGRPAPPRDGPAFMREAYSHEVISHGFWPGSAPVLEPAFYAYAVPEPAGLKQARIRPDAAFYHDDLGEFILPYGAVRASPAPAVALREFIDSTYDAAATLGNWDRAALERS